MEPIDPKPIHPEPLPRQVWLDHYTQRTTRLLFAIDLLFRFIMSPTKRHFFRKNLLDTITVVIPQLRALRALRAFTSGGVLSSKGLLSSGAIATATLAVLLVVWVGGLGPQCRAQRPRSGDHHPPHRHLVGLRDHHDGRLR
ncbi:MAG: hypothetical protein WCH93_12405 [Actinomycetota bacterium]